MAQAREPLRIETRRENGTLVVHLRGDVDLRSAPDLHERLLTLLESPPQRMIVDLGAVHYMDSSGVGTLVDLKRRLERAGGRLVLVRPPPRVMSIFQITRLDAFFTIAADLEEARRL